MAKDMPASAPPEKKIVIPEQSSQSAWFAFFGVILVVVSVNSIYDEAFVRRPWKRYQTEFKKSAVRAYRGRVDRARHELEALERHARLLARSGEDAAAKKGFAALTREDQENARAYHEARKAADAAREAFGEAKGPEKEAELLAKIREADQAIALKRKSFQKHRGDYQAVTWQYEIYHKQRLLPDRAGFKKLMDPLEEEMFQLEARKRAHEAELEALRKPLRETEGKLATFQGDIKAARNLLQGIVDRPVEVRHIFNDDLGIVDRCESCHAGISDPGLEGLDQPFATHPGDWLKTHPRENFACSSCHRGEGYATSSAWKAHGEDHYWLSPMLPGELMQAACYKCHEDRTVLRGADTLMKGKRLVQQFGCVGCHKIRALREEPSEVTALTRDLSTMGGELAELEKQYARAQDDDDAERLAALGPEVRRLRKESRDLERARDQLVLEVRQIGPDLTRVATKVHWGWIVPWLSNPSAFRPHTRMPRFWPEPMTGYPDHDRELESFYRKEIEQAAAYIVEQSEKAAPRRYVADPAAAERGQHLVEEVGCRGCHNVTAADAALARDERRYGPDLERVGEKVRFEWMVAWVQDPESIQPHAKMPDLRLTEAQALDVAHYLMTLRKDQAGTFADVPEFLADEAIRKTYAVEGEKVVRKYGCFGCHTLEGMENESRIGTELSQHGVKMLQEFDWGTAHLEEEFEIAGRNEEAFRRDFAHLAGGKVWKEWRREHMVRTADGKEDLDPDAKHLLELLFWRRHDGKVHLSREMYLATKLMHPRIFDHGRLKDFKDRLKMPRFNFKPDEILAITTFLMSLTPELDKVPAQFREGLAGTRGDQIQGDRLIQKFNCAGCHRFDRDPPVESRQAIMAGVSRYGARATHWLSRNETRPAERVLAEATGLLEGLALHAGLEAPAKPGATEAAEEEEWEDSGFEDDSGGDETHLKRLSKLLDRKKDALEKKKDDFFQPRAIQRKVQELTAEIFGELHDRAVAGLEGDVFVHYPPERKTLAPPPLYPVGAKVQPDWLFGFLKEPIHLRPRHEIRMPTFNMSDREATALVRYFSARSQEPFPYRHDERGQPTEAQIAEGKQLLDQSQCLKCHFPGLPGGNPEDLIAPNLDLAPRRLKAHWIPEWIKDPTQFQPGTNMPGFQESMGEGADAFANRLTDYLMHH